MPPVQALRNMAEDRLRPSALPAGPCSSSRMHRWCGKADTITGNFEVQLDIYPIHQCACGLCDRQRDGQLYRRSG